MTLRFIPPKMAAKYKYATYIPHLTMLKPHQSMSAAKNRVRHQCNYILPSQDGIDYYRRETGYREFYILENVNGEWFTLYHVPEGTKASDLPWMKEFYKDANWGSWTRVDDWFRESKWHQERLATGKIRIEKRPAPMDIEEYVQFRIQCHEEQKNGLRG